MWIALKEIRFGEGYIPRGGEVPLEVGRNYRLLERFHKIRWTGEDAPVYSVAAAPKESGEDESDSSSETGDNGSEGPNDPQDQTNAEDGLDDVPGGTKVEEGGSGWRTITFPDGVEVKAQGVKQFNAAIVKWKLDNPEQV